MELELLCAALQQWWFLIFYSVLEMTLLSKYYNKTKGRLVHSIHTYIAVENDATIVTLWTLKILLFCQRFFSLS